MTGPIYKPKGKALEYSPLALNLYEGCGHGCFYCYVPKIPGHHHWKQGAPAVPRDGIIERLKRQVANKKIREQVLLSFTSDPYNPSENDYRLTRQALRYLNMYNVPVAILTKGGARCLRDLDYFHCFGEDIKVGATLTYITNSISKKFEPGAAGTEERVDTLKRLHEEGIRTWVSFEPVVDPSSFFSLYNQVDDFVDEIMVGKWNYSPGAEKIDWVSFAQRALAVLRLHRDKYNGPRFYIKQSLQSYFPPGVLDPEEIDPTKFYFGEVPF